MKQYKNIVFDVGGVLMSYRWLEHIRETIPDEDKAKDFAHRMFDDPLWLEFDIELRPFDDVVEDYVKKYPEDEKHFRYVLGHLEGMPLPRERVWKKVHELKEAGYRIYLLSNYSSRMFHTHTDGLPFHEDVDGRVISYEVHHLKPHREIYEDLFSKYDLDPAECLFFDDRQENVDGGRKCGMDGRVIYSEEALLGYLDRLLAKDGINNPFHDPAVSRDERIDWLLSNMTVEEKIMLYSHPEQGVGRFGVEGFVLGGEASHGAECRNDQNGIGDPDVTTSFPNPIGMSASWDPELIEKVGEIISTEARACWKRHRRIGLCRWLPTIDLERDPRWGRNEEGYGEDPMLTSKNAMALIRGMRGEDPDYVRCGVTLKHFYANNVENTRFFTNSSVGLRDKWDYYIPQFKKAIQEAGALGVMAAYNRINGIPGMLNPEIRSMLKGEFGVTHVVCDGFAMTRLKDYQHVYGTLAQCVAAAIKAGADSMSDKPEYVEPAIRDAMKLKLLTETELDEVLKNILMVGMKLGIYDPDGVCPYDSISAEDCDTEEARSICRKLSEESIVLLENKDHTLPLERKQGEDIALIGPLADEWYADWYAGVRPFSHTVKDGLTSLLDKDLPFATGLDRYRIVTNGKAWHIEKDGTVTLSDIDDGDLFCIEDWNDGNHTIRSIATGKYVQSCFYGLTDEEMGYLKADRDNIFDWFVTCKFHLDKAEDGSITLKDRFAREVAVTSDGRLKADDKLPRVRTELIKISDGIEEAMAAAEDKNTVILVLGCNPMVSAREDYDRTSIALPAHQQRLLDAFTATDRKIITVLLSNYPYTFDGAERKTDAMLLSASGSEYMGDAVAAVLFGEASPAGRLVQTWPVSEKVLPDMNDYRIIGRRTYRYVSDGVLYPFGYGLSYGDTEYSDLTVQADEGTDLIRITLSVKNTGDRSTDEVIQIYASADFEDDKFLSAGYGRRLIAFCREKDLKPGESRKVVLTAQKEDLKTYDVVRGEQILYGGKYHVYIGRDALSEILSIDTELAGPDFEIRDLSQRVEAYACDDHENAEFVKGGLGMTAVVSDGSDAPASLSFIRCRIPEDVKKAVLLLKSEKGGKVELLWNGKTVGTWSGNTSTPQKPYAPYEPPTELTVMPGSWPALWAEMECGLKEMSEREGTLTVRIYGDTQLLSISLG